MLVPFLYLSQVLSAPANRGARAVQEHNHMDIDKHWDGDYNHHGNKTLSCVNEICLLNLSLPSHMAITRANRLLCGLLCGTIKHVFVVGLRSLNVRLVKVNCI